MSIIDRLKNRAEVRAENTILRFYRDPLVPHEFGDPPSRLGEQPYDDAEFAQFHITVDRPMSFRHVRREGDVWVDEAVILLTNGKVLWMCGLVGHHEPILTCIGRAAGGSWSNVTFGGVYSDGEEVIPADQWRRGLVGFFKRMAHALLDAVRLFHFLRYMSPLDYDPTPPVAIHQAHEGPEDGDDEPPQGPYVRVIRLPKRRHVPRGGHHRAGWHVRGHRRGEHRRTLRSSRYTKARGLVLHVGAYDVNGGPQATPLTLIRMGALPPDQGQAA